MATNSIDRAMRYCASFDPGFPDLVRGADPEMLTALEEAQGRPLVPVQRRFLERFGEDSAWMGEAFGYFDVETLIDAHRRTEGRLPDSFSLFAVSDDEIGLDTFLVDIGEDEPVPRLMYTRLGGAYDGLADDRWWPVSGTVAEMICLDPLQRFVLDVQPLHAAYGQHGDPAPLMKDFDDLGDFLQMAPMWFSNWMTRVVVRGTTTVVAKQAPGYPLVVTVAGSDLPFFEGIGKLLQERLGLVAEVVSTGRD